MRLLPCDFKDIILNLLRLKGPSNEVKVLNSTQVESAPVDTCSGWWSLLNEEPRAVTKCLLTGG